MTKAPSRAVLRPCLGCGVLVRNPKPNAGARCLSCEKARKKAMPGDRKPHTKSSSERGYTYAWQRLSREARRTHPFCMDCGTHEDLTADHLRWPARTLADVEVVCRSCNSKRGALRRNGKPVASRIPLHGYAEPSDGTWGVDPYGGVLDREGGAPFPVTLADGSECSDDDCMVMHPDSV